ncbi:MAG: multidrug efflux pump, partial [Ulvibacter sp.]
TFLTLIVVPILFFLVTKFNLWVRSRSSNKQVEVLDLEAGE